MQPIAFCKSSLPTVVHVNCEWRHISCVVRIWWKDDTKKNGRKKNVLLATCSHQLFIIISLVCFYNVQKRIRTFLSVAFFALHFLALGFKFRISSISIVSCFRVHNAMTPLYASASAQSNRHFVGFSLVSIKSNARGFKIHHSSGGALQLLLYVSV